MAEVTASMIKELRERTQAGMSDCKSALVEASGDLDKAVEIILKKGVVKAASRAGRIATEGEIGIKVSADRKRAVIVEVNCQTDFVARGDDFRGFVRDVAAVIETMPKDADIAAQTMPSHGKTVDVVRQELIAKTGENIVVRRWNIVDASASSGVVQPYVHMGGKLAVVAHITAPTDDATKTEDFQTFADNIAMQIAGMSPLVVEQSQLSTTDISKQREIFEAQLKEEGREADAIPKQAERKIKKWFTEVALLDQDSLLKPGRTVDDTRQTLGKKLGGDVVIKSFVRFALGEGIEKKPDDLAAEVAKLM